MKNRYKILMLLVVTLALSGCTTNNEVELANKAELLERNFKEFSYDEKDAYISSDNTYVAVLENVKITEVFLTEGNESLISDDTGIYISNGSSFKLYSDKCMINEKEFEIKATECENEKFGNNLNKYVKDTMPEIIK